MGPDLINQEEWLRWAVDEYSGPLTRHARLITGDLDRARDVVQDTFLRLWKEPRRRIESHLAEWLFTVCRHRALDVVRKEKRMRPFSDTDLASRASPEPSPAMAAEQQDNHSQALAALATLPLNQQEVVRLKFQNGLSYAEISRVTRLSVSNVGFLIHTAIRTLRQRVHAPMNLQPVRKP